jgi:hypothetical protein
MVYASEGTTSWRDVLLINEEDLDEGEEKEKA